MNFLILVFFFFSKDINAQEGPLNVCKTEELGWCETTINSWSIELENKIQAFHCLKQLKQAHTFCSQGSSAGTTASGVATTTAVKTDSNTVSQSAQGTSLAGDGATLGASSYTQCGYTAKAAASACSGTGIAACMNYQSFLTTKCPQFAAYAGETAARANMASKAADALKSNWKPLLIGAAVGAGAMALMGGKKGGDGGGTPAPAPKPADKLPDLKLNGSTTSAAPAPSVVYYPPSNNNGSLGNPAVTGSTTSTSTPADTVKIAGITPSTSFASGQGSSISPDTSSRTISSSGAAAPASASSGGTGSTDSGGGVGGGGSDSAILVDTSGKGAGGGGSFSGGIDGGSGSSTQAASDGMMIFGIPGGKNDSQSAKVKALASKKDQVAQTQPSPPNSKPLARRRLATPPVKKDLKQYMRSKHLIK